MEGVKISREAARRTAEAVRHFHLTSRGTTRTAEALEGGAPLPIVAILLSELGTGDIGEAVVLEPENADTVQIVSLFGSAGGGTFTLGDGTDDTEPIPWNATALELEEALEALPSIGRGNVDVRFGRIAEEDEDGEEVEYNLCRWFVRFVGRLAETDVPLLGGDR